MDAQVPPTPSRARVAVRAAPGRRVAGRWSRSLGLALVLLASAAASATELLTPAERAFVTAHPRVRLGLESSFPPFVFLDEAGKPRGISLDVLARLGDALGLQFDTVASADLSGLLEKARTGEVEVLTSLMSTDERSQYLLFTRPYVSVPAVIIVRKTRSGRLALDELRGVKIAVGKGYAVEAFLRTRDPSLQLVPVANDREALRMLSFGEVGAAITDVGSAAHVIITEKLTNLRAAGEVGFNYELSLAVSRNAPLLRDALDKGLAHLGDEQQQAIIKAWTRLGEGSSRSWWWAGGGLLGLCGLLLFTVRRLRRERMPRRDGRPDEMGIGPLPAPARGAWLGWLVPLAVLAMGLLLTLEIHQSSQHATEQLLGTRFALRVNDLVGRIEQRLRGYEQALRGTRGLFEASEKVDRREFAAYVKRLAPERSYPGIQGVGFSVALGPQERAAHVAQVRAEVKEPRYELRPEGERPFYTSILYLEPFRDRNLRAFGFDMYSEPVRRAAMERSRDSDEIAISGKIQLVKETQTNVQSGFLMYLAVYRNGAPHASPPERRAALQGWVYAPFRCDDLMAGIRGPQYADLALKLFDGEEVADDHLLFATPEPSGPPAARRFTDRRLLRPAGHRWTLEVGSSPQFESELAATPLSIPLAGAAASLLAALMARLLLRGRTRALALAYAMTKELREREAWLRAIYEGSTVGISRWDLQWRLIDANPAFLRMLGYTLDELVGTAMGSLLPPERKNADLHHHQALTPDHLPQSRHETCWVRQDGASFWVSLSVQPVLDEVGRPSYFFAVVEEITERKTFEEQLAQKQTELEQLNLSLEGRIQKSVDELRAKDQLLITQNRQAAMGEMLGNIAHQWRQPLNALGLVLANLRDASRFDELDGPTVEQAVADGNRLIGNMSTTINDFRDFFSPEKHKKAFSALAQVEETVGLVGASFRHAGLTLVIEADADVRLYGFANEYSQVLLNLLSNARQAIANAGTANGTVTLRVGVRDGLGCVTVRDNGGGIPEAVVDRIFEPYFSTKKGGTGIGLYMSRQIVERSLGGRLLATNVDGGAEFTILTPLFQERAG